ncbi:THAP-type domain-containing protein [Aphis craccivora]|uniref:THAP-type domain-containing protein n=1 Tax=Aphis craccivora TaxID=307492 RepID=A0A6G0Y037_APHCR|nr:THAP-type domain-containing protein [Aphis craccivora]
MGRAAYKCCVNNCLFKGGVSHRFPNPKLYMATMKEWIKTIGPQYFDGLGPEIIYHTKRICSNHFTSSSYSLGTNRLNKNSILVLNLAISIETVEQTVPKTVCAIPHTTIASTDSEDFDRHFVSNVRSPSPASDLSGFESLHCDDENDLMFNGSADYPNSGIGYADVVGVNVRKTNSKKKTFGLLCKIGMKRSSQLTPKCKSLYADSNFSCRNGVGQHFKFETVKSDDMTTAATIFTKLQLRETNNKVKGRRFSLEEKLLSLSPYKKSAKSYSILSKLFTLPGRRTLTNLLSKLPTGTGIDKTIIKVLGQNVKNLTSRQKYCVVLFDEMSLESNLQYCCTGSISGFEDNGVSRTQNFADHALVFMIRGVIKKYKQPISCTFCKSTTSSHDLANQIRNVLKAVQSTGLKIVATISDQGATNIAAINILKNDTTAHYLR